LFPHVLLFFFLELVILILEFRVNLYFRSVDFDVNEEVGVFKCLLRRGVDVRQRLGDNHGPCAL